MIKKIRVYISDEEDNTYNLSDWDTIANNEVVVPGNGGEGNSANGGEANGNGHFLTTSECYFHRTSECYYNHM